jgi:hypothetical protein
MHPSSFLGEVCVQVSHEVRELLRILGRNKQMKVVREEGKGVKAQWIPLHRTSQDSDYDACQIAGW